MKYNGPKCKLCRREGKKLFLKGKKCFSTKCPFVKKPFAPGAHQGKGRMLSDFGVHLRAKQAVMRYYGVHDKQMRKYNNLALKKEGSSSEIIFKILESRIDNVIFRSGVVLSRSQARQFITHGFVTLNNKKVKTPSITLSVGDVIKIRGSDNINKLLESNLKGKMKGGIPEWVAVEPKSMEIKIVGESDYEKQDLDLNFTLVTEYYSRM